MALSKVNPNFVSQTPYGNRNLIINGAMLVAQRGTSFTNKTTETYGADRINAYATNMGTFDVSQSTDAPDGFAKSFKFVCNTADASPASTDETVVQYKIEGQDLQQLGYGTSSAKTITVSFYVRSSETGDFGLWLYNEDGGRQAASSYSINTANTWERKELTFAGDTSNGINDDTGVGMYLRWYLGSGSAFIGSLSSTWSSSTNRVPTGGVNIQGSANRNWYITGIQLEVGDTATPFEHRSYGEELALCQRYYQRLDARSTYDGLMNGMFYVTTQFYGLHIFPVQMRSNPSMSGSGTFSVMSNGNDKTPDSLIVQRSNVHLIQTYSVLSGGNVGTAGHAGQIRSNNNADTFLEFIAEL